MTRFYVQIIFIPVHNLLTGFPELDKDVNYDDYVYATCVDIMAAYGSNRSTRWQIV